MSKVNSLAQISAEIVGLMLGYQTPKVEVSMEIMMGSVEKILRDNNCKIIKDLESIFNKLKKDLNVERLDKELKQKDEALGEIQQNVHYCCSAVTAGENANVHKRLVEAHTKITKALKGEIGMEKLIPPKENKDE